MTAALLLATRPYELLPYTLFPFHPLRTLWVVVLAAAVWLAWRRDRARWLPWSIVRLPFLWMVWAGVVLSGLWSLAEAPWVLSQLTVPLLSTLAGILLGYLVSPNVLMGALGWGFALFLVASLTTELLAIAAVADSIQAAVVRATSYRWTGTTINPNHLGEVTAAATAYAAVALLHGRLYWPLASAMLAVAVLLTVLSGSATSIIMLIAAICAIGGLTWARRLRFGAGLTALLMLVGLVGSAAIALTHWDVTSTLLGKNVSATGRSELWQEAIEDIQYHPLEGFKYWRYTDAHNGYLQMAREFGLPIAAASVVFLARAIFNGMQAFGRFGWAFALFATSYLVQFAVGNLAETRLFDSSLWLLAVLLGSALARASEARLGSRPAAGRARAGRRGPERGNGATGNKRRRSGSPDGGRAINQALIRRP